MKKGLTVIMTTYNRCRYLEQTIKSILNQTFQDFDFYVLDNASTDDTEKVVRKYSERIVYIRNEKNLGYAGNVNKAIDLCETEFLSIVHDDDIYFPTIFERELEVFQTHPEVSLVAANCLKIDEEGAILEEAFFTGEEKIFKKYELFEQGIAPPNPSWMYRVEFIKKKKLRWIEGLESDVIFVNELNLLDTEIFYIDEPMFYYRVHKKQLTYDIAKFWPDFFEYNHLKAIEHKVDALEDYTQRLLSNALLAPMAQFDYNEDLLEKLIVAFQEKDVFRHIEYEKYLFYTLFMKLSRGANFEMKTKECFYNQTPRTVVSKIVEKWIKNIDQGIYLATLLKEKGIKNVGIYGRGVKVYFALRDCLNGGIDVRFHLWKDCQKVSSLDDIILYDLNRLSRIPQGIDVLLIVEDKNSARDCVEQCIESGVKPLFIQDIIL